MSDDVARLVAVLEANLKGFQKGMDQAQRIADRRFGQIERRMNQAERRFAGAFKNIGNAIISGAAFIGISRFVSSIVRAADELSNVSEALNVGTDSLQTWGVLASRAGVGQEQFNKSLEGFAQRLGEAQLKGGAFAKFLNGLGVGTSGTTQDVFFRLADAIKETASQQQRAAIVAEAFGAKNVKLVTVLQQGSAALKAQGIEFAKNGQIITRENIAKIDDLGDKWEELKRQFQVAGANVLGGFTESFSRFADDLSSPQFQAALENFGRVMGEIAVIAAKLAPVLPNLLGALAGARIGRFAGAPGAVVGGIIGGLAPELLERQAATVAELERELQALKSTLDSLPPEAQVFTAAQINSLEKQIAELKAARQEAARAAGIPFAGAAAGGTAPGGTIDRTGTLSTESKSKSLTEQLGEPTEGIKRLQDALDDARKAEADFVSEQFRKAKEIRDQAAADAIERREEELEELKQFHADAEAAWDDYWERQAQMAQDAHDILKEDIGDSLLFLGEAALQGGDAFANAMRQMIIQATLLAIKLNVLKPLLDWALGSAPGGGFLGGLIDGRASGGRVNPNQPYIVGESRPELFVPDTAGTIIPKLPTIASPQSASMGGMVVNLSQTMTLAANGDAQVAQIAEAAAARGAMTAVKTIQRNFPAMMIRAQRDRL